MANRRIQTEVTADISGFVGPLRQGEDKARQFSKTLDDEGKKGEQAFKQPVKGAKGAADEIDRSTRSIISSIQRATAAAEAGGRGTAAYFEQIASQRGANGDALRPYIEGLRKAEAAQASAAAGLGGMEMSAKQTAAALRGVPAQFTDIFTSLASGQQPLTVFLQQGGQLKDMFGGAGNAARALGGYMLGLINPFTVAGVAVLALGAGFLSGRREADEFTRQIVLTGNASGTTAGQLTDMAAAIGAAFGTTKGQASEVLAQLVATGQVGASGLQKVAQAAIDLERVGGPAAQKTVDAFADLGRKPLEASLKLNEATRFLTLETYRQIKAAEEQGRSTDAARIAQEAYSKAIGERVPQIEQSLGYVERAWKAVTGATREAVDAVKNIGREFTITEQLAQLNKQVADIDASQGLARDRDGRSAQARAQARSELQQQIAALSRTALLSTETAAAQAEIARQVENAARWDKIRADNADKSSKWAQEEKRIREAGLAAGIKEKEITDQIAAARARMFAGDNKSNAKELDKERDLIAQLSGLTSTYSEDLARLQAIRARGNVTEQRYVELVNELILKQPFAKEIAQEEAKTYEQLQRNVEAMTKERIRAREEVEKANAGGLKTVEQLRDEYVQLTAGKGALAERVMLRMEEQAIDLERQALRAEEVEADTKLATLLRERAGLLRQEMALRKGIASAEVMTEQRTASEKAAQDALRAWERTNEQISQSLTDAIMRGGKSAGEYLKDYFRTLVLKPIIEPIARNLAAILTGGGAPGAGGGLSGLLNMLSGGGASNVSGQVSTALLRLGDYLATSQSSTANRAGSVLQNNSGRLGQFAGMLGNAGAGYGIGTAIRGGLSDGYSVGRGYNRYQEIGMAVASAVGGPVMGAIIGAATGVVNRLFGRRPKEVTESGVEGVVSAAGFTGDSFEAWRQQGGLFRSDRSGRDRSAVQGDLETTLDAGVTAVYRSAQTYADALGLPADAARNFAGTFKVVWGKTEEENRAAIEQAIGKLSDDLAGVYAQQLTPLKRASETISQTLQRLGVLQSFSRTINDLGGVFSRVARLGVDAREAIIDMAGGMEAFADKATSFAQNFYGRDEIAGLKARDVQQRLADLGINQTVNTRDEFRRLVEGTDVTASDGQRRLVELLNLSAPFAEVADYLAETGKSLAEAARAAPETSVLAPLFADGSTAQVQAINAVGSGIGNVVDRLDQLLALVRAGSSSAVQALVPSEVGLADYNYNPGGA